MMAKSQTLLPQGFQGPSNLLPNCGDSFLKSLITKASSCSMLCLVSTHCAADAFASQTGASYRRSGNDATTVFDAGARLVPSSAWMVQCHVPGPGQASLAYQVSGLAHGPALHTRVLTLGVI